MSGCCFHRRSTLHIALCVAMYVAPCVSLCVAMCFSLCVGMCVSLRVALHIALRVIAIIRSCLYSLANRSMAVDSSVFVFRPHRIHDMRPVAINDAARMSVCKSVSLYVTRLRCVNMAERIEILFGVKALGTQGTL